MKAAINGNENGLLRLALPKGRMEGGVLKLLSDAGISDTPTARGYRPAISLPDTEPKSLLQRGGLPERHLIVASEYERLTGDWIGSRALDAEFVKSFGATEVFPPEDADVIVDNTATGNTLAANDLVVVDTLLASSTRLYACPQAMEGVAKRTRIEHLQLLLKSVLDARKRVMVEVNAPADKLAGVVALLPCMREATVSPLYGNSGYAVKAAVPREQLPQVIPAIKAAGGSDVVVTALEQIVP
jgi:ATP phosphoribosyltransferase